MQQQHQPMGWLERMNERRNDRKNTCTLIIHFFLSLNLLRFTTHLYIHWKISTQYLYVHGYSVLFRNNNNKKNEKETEKKHGKMRRSCELKSVDIAATFSPILSPKNIDANAHKIIENRFDFEDHRPPLAIFRLSASIRSNWLTLNVQVHFHSFITIY